MGTLLSQIKKLQRLNPQSFNEALFKQIKGIEKYLIDLNTKDQLLKSIDAEGDALYSRTRNRGVYSILTEELSGGRKKAGNPYTLIDSRKFINGFHLTVKSNSVIFNSTDSKTDLLRFEYGEIFGLTDKNLKETIDLKLRPFLQQHIRQTLDL